AIVRVEPPARHELVDVLVPLIVAHIDDDAPILCERGRRALILLAAKRRALLRRGAWIVWIDLDDPAIKRWAAGVLGEVELAGRTVSEASAWIAEGRRIQRERGIVELRAGVERTDKEPVEIFFRREIGAPRRQAAGAVRGCSATDCVSG